MVGLGRLRGGGGGEGERGEGERGGGGRGGGGRGGGGRGRGGRGRGGRGGGGRGGGGRGLIKSSSWAYLGSIVSVIPTCQSRTHVCFTRKTLLGSLFRTTEKGSARSSSWAVRIRVPFSSSVVYFRRGTLPQKKGKRALLGPSLKPMPPLVLRASRLHPSMHARNTGCTIPRLMTHAAHQHVSFSEQVFEEGMM